MASWLLPAIGFLNIPRGSFVFRFSLWMDHIFFLRTVYWLYDKGLSSKTFWQKLIQNWAFDFIWKKYRSTRTLRKFIPGNCRWNWSKICYFTFHEVSFRPLTGNGQNLINLPRIRFVEQQYRNGWVDGVPRNSELCSAVCFPRIATWSILDTSSDRQHYHFFFLFCCLFSSLMARPSVHFTVISE